MAWTGLLDRRTGELDAGLLAAAGIGPGHLSPPRDMTEPAPPVAPARWPALARAMWFPVITDGFASNIGSGATDARVLTASTATSGALRVLLDGPADPLPFGMWNYRVDAGRTLLGGAINDVGRTVSWAQSTLRLGPALAATLTAPPNDATPLVLPYLTGERSPGWVGEARAVLDGVSAATDADALFRGIVEGVAITYARVADELPSPPSSRTRRTPRARRRSLDTPARRSPTPTTSPSRFKPRTSPRSLNASAPTLLATPQR